MKKTVFVLAFLVMAVFAAFPQSLGDVNGNGNIDIVDALLVAQYYVGLDPQNFSISLSDVNASGGTDIVDALLIAQFYVGLIDRFPGEPAGGCTGSGNFTYTLSTASSPTQDERRAYTLITEAMEEAVSYYNCHTNIVMHVTVYYDPGVPTAQANWNGPISFGGETYMNYITAMHEMSHCAGVGTHSRWRSLVVDGIFTGTNATNQLRAITGNPEDVLHADTQHFWPYGLNYTSEVTGEEDLINHCRMVVAIRKDLGI
ncbi:MAG: dockerin type I repeat-containing protein [Spirochaetales bacterium]|nr:dockerin type I repeat-containing protein [Spirochaetales bacterium]